MFYKQVTLCHGLPFAVNIPNAETCWELQKASDCKDLVEYENLDALKVSVPDDQNSSCASAPRTRSAGTCITPAAISGTSKNSGPSLHACPPASLSLSLQSH